MREIKFRGRDEHGDWHYGAFMGVFFDGVVAPIEYANIYDDGMANRVLPDTVGQFTGLKDCDGREIYEGDILRFAPPWRWEEDERRIGVVVYKCYGFRIEYSDTSEALFNLAANDAPYTIIGNVHDTPELLEGKDA